MTHVFILGTVVESFHAEEVFESGAVQADSVADADQQLRIVPHQPSQIALAHKRRICVLIKRYEIYIQVTVVCCIWLATSAENDGAHFDGLERLKEDELVKVDHVEEQIDLHVGQIACDVSQLNKTKNLLYS